MFCWCEDKVKESSNLKIKKIQNYLYKKNDKIGQGHFSQVYEGIDDETGQSVAIKVVEINSIKTKTVLDMLQVQISIIRQLNHRNIIRCMGTFNSVNNYYIITEYCESGDLQKYLKMNDKLNQQEVQSIAYDIYEGLQYLAKNYIIHRDLKTANIFIKEGVSKIGDFGFAVKSFTTFKDISVGSPVYMSPEGLLRCQYGPKTDIWSYGVLLYELLHGQTPLGYCENQKQLRTQILKPIKFDNTISTNMKNFISLCLDTNQKTRISIQEISNTPFMKKVIANIQNGKINNRGINQRQGQLKSKYVIHKILNKIQPQQALSLLHYCRLIHKSTKNIPSMVLEQWLLTLSKMLVQATYDCTRQKAQKICEVLNGYHKKYINDHQVNQIERSVEQCIQQCKNLKRSPYDMKYINFLLKESELLLISFNYGNLGRFVKQSKSQQFLSKNDLQSSRVLKENPNPYIYKNSK